MDQLDGLSKREREVAKLLLEGKSNKLIAAALHITENTVEFHLKNIYSKTQVNSRTELFAKLGKSVVANQEAVVENRDGLNLRNWSKLIREAISKFAKELNMEDALNSTPRNGDEPLAFHQAILICLKKYAEFRGRASRAEFWWFLLFIVLVASAFTYVSETLGSIFLILTLLPLLAAGARRLRDSGISPWWELFLLAPVGGIVVVGYFWTLPPVSQKIDDTL